MTRPRRPGSPGTRGVVASRATRVLPRLLLVGLGLLGLAGCSDTGPVPVSGPTPAAAERTRCQDLLDELPSTLADQTSRPVEPADSLAAAWGDPAIVLRCGDFHVPATARCAETNGVGWYIPMVDFEDQTKDVVLTTIGRTPAVQVTVPASYRPPASVMVGLARPILVTLHQDFPCT